MLLFQGFRRNSQKYADVPLISTNGCRFLGCRGNLTARSVKFAPPLFAPTKSGICTLCRCVRHRLDIFYRNQTILFPVFEGFLGDEWVVDCISLLGLVRRRINVAPVSCVVYSGQRTHGRDDERVTSGRRRYHITESDVAEFVGMLDLSRCTFDTLIFGEGKKRKSMVSTASALTPIKNGGGRNAASTNVVKRFVDTKRRTTSSSAT